MYRSQKSSLGSEPMNHGLKELGDLADMSRYISVVIGKFTLAHATVSRRPARIYLRYCCAAAAALFGSHVSWAAQPILQASRTPSAVIPSGRVVAQEQPTAPAQSAGPTTSRPTSGLTLPEITVERERKTALAVQAMSISATPDAGPINRHFAAIVGIGALDSPRYPGSNKMKVSPYPYVDIQGLLGGRMYLSDLNGIGFYLLDKQPFRVGVGVNRSSARNSSKNYDLRGLPDIGMTAEVKGFLAYTRGPFAMEAAVSRRMGATPGTRAQIAFGVGGAPSPKLHLNATVSLGWADASYQRLFFGVTPQAAIQAARAGNPLPVYLPKAGLTSAQLVFSAVYQFSVHWGFIARVGVSDLVGNQAKNSPLVRTTVGKSVAAGFAYMF